VLRESGNGREVGQGEEGHGRVVVGRAGGGVRGEVAPPAERVVGGAGGEAAELGPPERDARCRRRSRGRVLALEGLRCRGSQCRRRRSTAHAYGAQGTGCGWKSFLGTPSVECVARPCN